VQFGSLTGDGSFRSLSVAVGGAGAWATNTGFAGLNMVIRGNVPCGAPWLGAITPAAGTLAPAATQSTNVVISSSGLAAANYSGFVCVNSNDPVTPSAAVRVQLTVNP